MKALWYVCSGLMIANGLVMSLLLRHHLTGIMFIAIGVAFIVVRRYRLRRDRNRTFE